MAKNYGSTNFGMFQQIQDNLNSLGVNLSLANKLKLRNTFDNFLNSIAFFKMMDWASQLTKNLTKKQRKIILLINKNGFQNDKTKAKWMFEQQYNNNEKMVVTSDTIVGDIRRRKQLTFIKNKKGTIDGSKQALSIKANLIHHLDAIWVHTTAIKMGKELNVIHDCFGVLMTDVDELNIVVREVLFELFKNESNFMNLILSLGGEESDEQIQQQIKSIKKNFVDSEIDLKQAFYLIFP